jgi:hypothetical protein
MGVSRLKAGCSQDWLPHKSLRLLSELCWIGSGLRSLALGFTSSCAEGGFEA